MAGAQRWSAPGAGPRVRVSASRQEAIMISRFHSASTGSEYFQLSTSPCSVMRILPEKSPGGCARMARCVGPPPRLRIRYALQKLKEEENALDRTANPSEVQGKPKRTSEFHLVEPKTRQSRRTI